MSIARPAESAYDAAAPEMRAMIDQVVAELLGTADWTERPAVLLEMIDALELAFDADEIDDEAEGEPAAAEAGAADGPEFGEVLTYYIGAVLERLDEHEVTGPEQAAFYLLSCHPEHLEAAQLWLDQPGNHERFQAFIDANPDFAAVLDLVEEMYDAADED